jgi:error-prone DNA polymerase
LPSSDYIELHASSAFSFLRGASMPGDLAAAAARWELPGMAVCDRDGVFGAPRFYHAAKEAGVRPMVGAEITLDDGTVLPLLVANRSGYQNLCQLISHTKQTSRPNGELAATGSGRRRVAQQPSHDLTPSSADLRERKRPCFATWDEVAQYSEGLVALTGDAEGPLLSAWRHGGATAVAAPLQNLQRIFGPENLYVEVQRHRVRGEERAVRFLRDLAVGQNLPLLATGGVTHADRDARLIADVFTCLRHHTSLDGAGRLLAPNAERQVRSGQLMAKKFADLPAAITNTARLGDRLGFTLQDLGYQFPDFPVPPWDTMPSHLRKLVLAGIRDLIPRLTARYRRQIEAELALIEKLGFCGYFLIVADICKWARSHGILVQGRGSAANSVVCYALRITAVDPVKNRLLFERFLSEGRVGADGRPSWPDIDLDLPSGELRESVIQEVYRRYSPHGAAMTANVITYRGRGATRELGKVLGLSEDVMDRFSSLFHGGDFPHTLELEEQLEKSGLPREHPRAAILAQLHQQLHGLPRHLGQHSGGMVICGGRLNQVVPLEPASMADRVVVQWDKDDCEDLGIVKVDLLGLGMMAVLQDCFELCGDRGEELSLYTLPAEDPKTYQMLQTADTVGVFQVESRAQMVSLRRFKPACFYDIAMQVAIVRPGPIVGKLVHPVIRRRHQGEPVVCLDPEVHERLLPILERTYGVVLFQEQMLACAMELANYNGTQAEELRRAMGFSRGTERLERGLTNLRTAMRQHGWSDRICELLIESASNFAIYGFPESHSMSFALLAYASTWLKAHRPAEFVASLLNHQPMGFYGPATLVQDARRHGVKFLPVCVQHSEWACTVAGDKENEKEERERSRSDATPIPPVRLGLCYIKGLSEAPTRAMLAERAKQPFTDIDDWLSRTRFSAQDRRALAAIGALNCFAGHRRAALWQIESAWSHRESLFQRAFEQPEQQELLVAEESSHADSLPAAPHQKSPTLPPMSVGERVQADFALTGLTTGTHPMAHVRHALPDVWRASDLILGKPGDKVVVAGSVICRQRPGTAKGFVFISLEDETGVANCVVTPPKFEAYRLVINLEPALRITGQLQIQHGVIHIKTDTIAALNLTAVPEQSSHSYR